MSVQVRWREIKFYFCLKYKAVIDNITWYDIKDISEKSNLMDFFRFCFFSHCKIDNYSTLKVITSNFFLKSTETTATVLLLRKNYEVKLMRVKVKFMCVPCIQLFFLLLLSPRITFFSTSFSLIYILFDFISIYVKGKKVHTMNEESVSSLIHSFNQYCGYCYVALIVDRFLLLLLLLLF
jgi:hypothetical protein